MKKGLLLLAFSLATSAFADCYCVKEWIWGGCAAHECVSTLSEGGTSTASRGYHTISYQNRCSRTIHTAIRFKDTNNTWTTNGWFVLNPGQSAYVANTKNRVYYTFAKSANNPDVTLFWKGDDNFYSVRGETFGFDKRQFNATSWVDHKHTFSCDGISPFYSVALAWSNEGMWAVRVDNRANQAEREALQACNAASTAPCSIGANTGTGNHMCLAVVKGFQNNQLFASTRSNANDAAESAMVSCAQQSGNCSVQYKGCNQ